MVDSTQTPSKNPVNSSSNDPDGPIGEPVLRAIAMPADTNPNGDIFGGWLLAQMDLAGGSLASQRSRGRVATVAIDAMTFHMPVHVGDEVSCYCTIKRVGRTSITIAVETWTRPRDGSHRDKVTQGVFTYVAIGLDRRPRPVDVPDEAQGAPV